MNDFSKFYLWVSFLNGIPRVPYLFCADAIYCCYFIRNSLSIRSRLISLVFTMFIASLNDNIVAYIRGESLPIFADYFLPICTVIVWILFNICPFDLVFKISKYLSPFIAFAAGIINGRNVCNGIDLYRETGDGIVYVFTAGICYAFVKFLCVFIYVRISKQNIRSVFVILFELVLVGFIYIFFSEIYPIHEKSIRSLDEMKFIVQILTALLEVIRNFVSDALFGKGWNAFIAAVSFFIPYYGKTWIPEQSER